MFVASRYAYRTRDGMRWIFVRTETNDNTNKERKQMSKLHKMAKKGADYRLNLSSLEVCR